jgi:Tfp pilus assembly protein PilF
MKQIRLKVKGQKLKSYLHKVLILTFSFLLSTCLYSQDVNQLVTEGNKLIKEKKYDEAVKVLLAAKKTDEKSPLPDTALGMLYLQKDSLWEAEAFLKSAEKIAPELCGVQFTLALLYEKKGENENAANYWNRLIENPDFKDKDIAKKHLHFLGGEK